MSDKKALQKKCDLIAIVCSDYRHRSGVYTLDRAIREQFGQNVSYDVLAKPGAILSLADGPDEHTKTLMEDLQFLVKHHGVDKIWLVPHLGCSKYAQSCAFKNAAEEHARLVKDIGHATAYLGYAFPGVRIYGGISHMTPTCLLRVESVLRPQT